MLLSFALLSLFYYSQLSEMRVQPNAQTARPDLIKRYWKGALWSPSSFAASGGGAPISILKEYIDQQKTPS